MDVQGANNTPSRRAGLRATKRIDYSTLEGGALEEEAPLTKKTPSKEPAVKKGTPAKKARLEADYPAATPTHAPAPAVKEKDGDDDDDGDWDDDSSKKRSGGNVSNTKKQLTPQQQNTLKTMNWSKTTDQNKCT